MNSIKFKVFKQNTINFFVDSISVVLKEEKTNIEELLSVLKSIGYKTDDGDLARFTVDVNQLKIQYYSANNYVGIFKMVKFNSINMTLYLQQISVNSFLKRILTIDNLYYDIRKNIWNLKTVFLELYESVSHKIFMSFSKFIKKTDPTKINKLMPFKGLLNSIITNYVSQITTTPNGITKSIALPPLKDSIKASYMVTKKKNSQNNSSEIEMNNSYIVISKYVLFGLVIDHFEIHFLKHDKIQTKWLVQNFKYNRMPNNLTNISILDWLIYDDIGEIIIRKHYQNSSNILSIEYQNGNTKIVFSSIYLNVKPEAFKNMWFLLDSNITSIQKMFNHKRNLDYVANNFFIQFISINSFIINVSYYPKDCDYYALLVGNLNGIYKLINYENINISTKNVTMYYPYNFTEMMKKILNIWLKNIYKHQMQKIIKGTKLNKTINNMPVKFTQNVYYVVKKGLRILSQTIGGNGPPVITP